MEEQTTHQVYEPPVLVEVGQFSEDTLGSFGSDDEFVRPFPDA